jgi:hypothetical protein
MSFSNIEMIHLYIYFKQENAKKNLCFFSVAVFFAVFVLRKTVMGKLLIKEECLFRSHVYWGKNSILGCFWELSY